MFYKGEILAGQNFCVSLLRENFAGKIFAVLRLKQVT